ncbi:MAG TPA: hypothetical protein EYH34_03640 [Planctomycetes bacterium]|nr:hypothetical protein [Planctomycetota bacterium]
MSSDTRLQGLVGGREYFVPGTCYVAPPVAPASNGGLRTVATGRDGLARRRYLRLALRHIPRLLGAIDRNPYRPTYGCLDRQYWHYRTAAFASEMYQEGVLPLALVYATPLPDNRWYGNPRVRELAAAGIRFAARSSHPDGSCDDYYPFERALGAAVFSLQAAARAYQLLGLDDPELVAWFRRRARWIIDHDESGHLANHHAMAALGLLRVAQITGDPHFRGAARSRIQYVLGWQDPEGWFEEYGGADPGYQTITIDCLAKYWKATGDGQLVEPLGRALQFARLFLHPDHSYGGEYGSRGTYHFYPHGMELLAPDNPDAADLADGFLASVTGGTMAVFEDDRMVAHRLGNLIEAYLDWSPTRPPARPAGSLARYLSHARIFVRRTASTHTVISAARGGVFKHFGPHGRRASDTGLIVETDDGRLAVSQWHDGHRDVEVDTCAGPSGRPSLTVRGPLYWTRFETATPLKQSLLHTAMWAGGRWCRQPVRRFLQNRLITGRRLAPLRLTRTFEFPDDEHLVVTDVIELLDSTTQLRRMAFGTDSESAYVAASAVYQDAVLESWTDLSQYVPRLNTERRVVIRRRL